MKLPDRNEKYQQILLYVLLGAFSILVMFFLLLNIGVIVPKGMSFISTFFLADFTIYSRTCNSLSAKSNCKPYRKDTLQKLWNRFKKQERQAIILEAYQS